MHVWNPVVQVVSAGLSERIRKVAGSMKVDFYIVCPWQEAVIACFITENKKKKIPQPHLTSLIFYVHS